MILQAAVYPVDHIGLTTYFSAAHKAIDLGWRKIKNPPVYAVADGVVAGVGRGSDGGNYVFIRHEDVLGLENKTVYSRYYHLDSYNVKTGDSVKRYLQIGIMGNTGYSTGTHLHLDLSAYPKGHSSFPSDFRSYAVDPQKYLYRLKGQTVSEDSKGVMEYAVAEALLNKTPEVKPEVKPETGAHFAGMPISLYRTPLYVSSTAKDIAGYLTGSYYCYDEKVFSGRVRVTNSLSNLGKSNGVTGYIDLEFVNKAEHDEYTVVKGDSMWAIAKKHGITLNALIAANPAVKNPSLIYPGQKIIIPKP